MPRIRTIKPEFWSSPGIESVSMEARLAFIAMWNWADDYGRGTCEPRELHGFVFPRDEQVGIADFRRMLGEIHRAFGVMFYAVDGRHYYEIPSWDRHQKIDKRSQGKHPPAEGAEEWEPASNLHKPFRAEPSAELSEPSALEIGTGEQGNRGSRNRGTEESAPSPREVIVAFDTAWTHWPKKVEKKASLEKFKQAVKKLPLPELVEHITVFGQRYAETTDRQFVPALDAWLNGERWTDELPEAPRRQSAPQRLTRADENALEFERVYGGDQHGGTRSVPALDTGFGS